jgi:hypothetical protein
MPQSSEANRKPTRPNLEDWLQLPDTQPDRESKAKSDDQLHADSFHHEFIAPGTNSGAERAETWFITNPQTRNIPRSEADPPLNFSKISSEDPGAVTVRIDLNVDPKTRPDKAEIKRLEAMLAREFSDTLTGYNASSGTLGLTFLILSLLGWISLPLLRFLNTGAGFQSQGVWIIVGSTILALAGLHLALYWGAHKGSNIQKTKELDRILEERRSTHPCLNLDCVEPGTRTQDRSHTSRTGAAKNRQNTQAELRWRCSLFEIDLEGNPLCAVCDKYQAQ